MNTVFTVTALFSLLLSFARSPASFDLKRAVSKREMQLALTAFEVDGPGMTKQEAEFAREPLYYKRRCGPRLSSVALREGGSLTLWSFWQRSQFISRKPTSL